MFALPQVQLKILNPKIGQDPNFPLPAYATDGSAGVDLRACIDEPIIIKAGETALIGTGLSIYIKDPNFVGLIFPRSGLGVKHGIVLGNLTGVIDSDYQGEIMVCLWNRSGKDFTLNPAERMAQYVITPIVRPTFAIVDEFDVASERGAGGFGHTGRQ